MIKKLDKAFGGFMDCFGYCSKFPPNVDFDQDAFADELLKCIEDGFDYTIEKYGTEVPKAMPAPDIIID